MEQEVRWIDANIALGHVENALGALSEAKRTLGEYLRDGGLRAFATEMWVSEAPTIGKAWKATEKLDRQTAVELAPVVFRSSKRWSRDQDDWRWPYNRLSITIRTKPALKRRMIDGVKFAQEDIDRILKRKVPSKGGRPKDDVHWTAFWHALIDIAQQGRLSAETFSTAKKLREEVLFEINNGLGDSTVKPHVAAVWKKFVEPKG